MATEALQTGGGGIFGVLNKAARYYFPHTFNSVGKVGLGGVATSFVGDVSAGLTTVVGGAGSLGVYEHRMKRGLDNGGLTYQVSKTITDTVLSTFMPEVREGRDSFNKDQVIANHTGDHKVEKYNETIRTVGHIIYNGMSFLPFLAFYEIGHWASHRLGKLFNRNKNKDEHEDEEKKPKGLLGHIGYAVNGVARFIFRDCTGALLGSIPDILLEYAILPQFRDAEFDLKATKEVIEKAIARLRSDFIDGSEGKPARELSNETCVYLNQKFNLGFEDGEINTKNVIEKIIEIKINPLLEKANAQLESFTALPEDTKLNAEQVNSIKEISSGLSQVATVFRSFHDIDNSPKNEKTGYHDFTGKSHAASGIEREKAELALAENKKELREVHDANANTLGAVSNMFNRVAGGLERQQEGKKTKGAVRGLVKTLENFGIPKGATEWFMTAFTAWGLGFNLVRITWYDIYDRLFPKDEKMREAHGEKPFQKYIQEWPDRMIQTAFSVFLGALVPAGVTNKLFESREDGAINEYTEQVARTSKKVLGKLGKMIGGEKAEERFKKFAEENFNANAAGHAAYRMEMFGLYLPGRMGFVNSSPLLSR